MKHSAVVFLPSIILMALPLVSCAQPGSRRSEGHFTTEAMLSGAAPAGAITVDGDTADWPGDTPILADDHYLYLRFAVENTQYTLQSSPTTTSILLDLDSDTNTGETSGLAPFDRLGVDLEVNFSPRQGAAVKNGVFINAVDSAGKRTPLSTADMDLVCSPTYASSWYEVRISRVPSVGDLLPLRGLRSRGEITGIFATRDTSGRISGYSDLFTTAAPEAAKSTLLGTADLPAKPEGAIRIMSYNVEKSGPMEKGDLFKRMFQAAKPDIILVQEWEKGDAAAVQSWFTAMVDADAVWSVRKAQGDNSTGGGVAIISRYPMSPVTGDTLSTTPAAGASSSQNPRPHAVRFISSTISTPVGDFLVASTHLKCCGTKDSPEDRTRLAEARAINQFLSGALAAAPQSTIRILSGDLNLVGSRPPLDLLRAGLDSDKSDLTVATPLVLGDRTLVTWRDTPSNFGPGRLDYLLYSDANAEIVTSLVLDTTRLTDASLARLGLDRTDSQASDHLPIIVDVKPKR